MCCTFSHYGQIRATRQTILDTPRRRGLEKQKAFWGEKLHKMKQLGIEYRPEWAAKAK